MSAFKLWKWQGSEFGLDRGNGNGEPSVFWKQAVSESTVPRRKRLTLCGTFLARVLSVFLHTHLPSSFDLRGENDFRKAFFSPVYFPFGRLRNSFRNKAGNLGREIEMKAGKLKGEVGFGS